MMWLKVDLGGEFNKFEFGVFFHLELLPYQIKELYLPYYLPITGGRIISQVYLRVFALCENAGNLIQDLNSVRRR